MEPKDTKYVVTYRIGLEDEVFSAIMAGNELATLYGFSDCSYANSFKVWEIMANGNLVKCELQEGCKWSNNVLCITNTMFGNVDMYWWNEH